MFNRHLCLSLFAVLVLAWPAAAEGRNGIAFAYAAEQGMGITLGRGLLAADALSEGRLVQLAPQTLADDAVYAYWIAYPGALAEWPPLTALRQWLHAQMALSLRRLQAPLQRRLRK